MRFAHLQGPISGVIGAIAAYYAQKMNMDQLDLRQEAWLAIYRRPDKPMHLVAWTAISNAVAREVTHRKYHIVSDSMDRVTDDEPIEHLIRRMDVQFLLSRMPDDVRRAAIMMYWDGLTRQETARRIGVATTTVFRRFESFRLRCIGGCLHQSD